MSGKNAISMEEGTGSDYRALPETALDIPTLYNHQIIGKSLEPDIIKSSKKIIFEHKTPRDVRWRDIDFTIGKKTVLNNCWGEVPSGSICAVLGPSGSGKTSLLNILAGRLATRGQIEVKGRVNVGGVDIDPVQYRQNIAYVDQDDALMTTATPREALEFSALLRFHHILPRESVKQHVQGLLNELGLQNCADTVIGGNFIKGLSGGEKKRVSIGIELIADPQLVFLDEPTSGLDSFTSLNMIHLLKKLASYETTILLTIHQPSSQIFRQFDQIMFLNAGRVFYQGSFNHLLDYFANHGFVCPSNHNPADYIMTICQRESPDELTRRGMFDMCEPPLTLFSDQSRKIHLNVNKSFRFQSSFIKQLYHVTIREMVNTLRDVNVLKLRFGMAIFLGVLIGLIFLNAAGRDNADGTNLIAHFAVMVLFVTASMQRTAQAVIVTFPLERQLFLREYSTGTYYTLTYFLSKTLVELPVVLIVTIVGTLPIYYMTDMQGQFMNLVWIAYAISIESSSVAIYLGCMVSTIKKAFELVPVVFIPQLLFVGFFRPLKDIPVFLRWAQYLCGLKYAVNLALIEEFNPSLVSCQGAASKNCSFLLQDNDVDRSKAWLYIMLLIVLSIGFRVGGGILLMEKAERYY